MTNRAPTSIDLQPDMGENGDFSTEKFIVLVLLHWPECEVHSHALHMDQTNHKAVPSLRPGASKSGLLVLHEIAHKTSTSEWNRCILTKYHFSYFEDENILISHVLKIVFQWDLSSPISSLDRLETSAGCYFPFLLSDIFISSADTS